MTYSLPTKNVEFFLSELNKIRRGIHPNFRGDGVYNSEAVLQTFCRDYPAQAIVMASKLDSYDEVNNFHPARIKSFAKRIKKNLFIQAM